MLTKLLAKLAASMTLTAAFFAPHRTVPLLALSEAFQSWNVPFARRGDAGIPLPSVVQSVANSSVCNFGTCGPVSITTPTTGNKLIVLLFNTDSATDACTDNLSNSLTEQSGSPQITTSALSGGQFLHELAYIVPAGGVNAITCTFAGSFAEMWIVEVAGSSGAATMQAASSSAYVFGSCTPTPSATPTASPSLAFGIFYGDLVSPIAGPGWTTIGTVSTNGDPFFLEYKGQTGMSAVTATLSSNACTTHGPDGFVNIW